MPEIDSEKCSKEEVNPKKIIVKSNGVITRINISESDIGLSRTKKIPHDMLDPKAVSTKIASKIRKSSLVLHVIDLMDFESSITPELYLACRNRDLPVIFVLTKIDCLPKGANL